MTEMFGEALPPMSVPDLAPDDDEAKNIILRATDLYAPMACAVRSNKAMRISYNFNRKSANF